jgi:peptide/nickel transport system substrate-binding protein
MRNHRSSARRRVGAVAVTALTLGMIATSCGGAKAGQKTASLKSAGLTWQAGESGLKAAGKPVRGGTLNYGVEADTASYCLPEAQLAISGMLAVRAVYDTLTVPNSKGDYVPYLAKAIDHNAAYDQWTITLRPNIKFSDGSALDSTVVKNNLDAYRGQYKGRSPLLFLFVFQNIDTVTTDGAMKVVVKTKVPWVAFPAYLYASSRLGMMGQKQLDAAPKDCGTKLIGTGPFNVDPKYTPNIGLTAKRNPSYWQTAPDGKSYPYADAINFQVTPDSQVRNQSIQSGTQNIMHTSNGQDIGTTLKDLRDQGKVNMLVSEKQAEVAFTQINNTMPPFNDIRMRKAFAMAADRNQINQQQNNGLPTVANGPFYEDSIGYLKDSGFPKYDLAGAKKLIDDYKKSGGNPDFNLSSTPDESTLRLAEAIQSRAQQAGIKVNIIKRDQAALINDAIGKKYQAMTFRNFPGGDPDTNYVWWYGKGNPVNFEGYDDVQVNKLLDEGRSETDPAKRAKIYQDLSRRINNQVLYVWGWFTPWAVVEGAKVHNILGPPLPGTDPSKPGDLTTTDPARMPNQGLATAHSLLGLFIAK